MFPRWSDVLGGIATVAALIYVALQVVQRQRRLREIFDVLDEDDLAMVEGLDRLLVSGRLHPVRRHRARSTGLISVPDRARTAATLSHSR